MTRQLCFEDYTVGLVCALPTELVAVRVMLDEEHGDLSDDENLYTLGSMAGHNVVIVYLPAGRISNSLVEAVVTQMRVKFKGIQFGLMAGFGGCVPNLKADIQLGDVVVSQLHQTFSGIIQHDIGKATLSGFKRTGSLNSPPQIPDRVIARAQADELRSRSSLFENIPQFRCFPKTGPDILLKIIYDHKEAHMCKHYSTDSEEARQSRKSEEEVVVHYGAMSTGNQVVVDAAERDKVSTELGGVLHFEMEAAGLVNSFLRLVICSMGDYADLWDSIIFLECSVHSKNEPNIQGSSSVEEKVMAASECTYWTTLSDKESDFSVQLEHVPVPGTEISHDDHSSLKTTLLLQAVQLQRVVRTSPTNVHGSSPIELKDIERVTPTTLQHHPNDDNRYDDCFGVIENTPFSNETFHSVEDIVADHHIPAHNDFMADPAHKYWTWSEKHGNWWHEDMELHTVIWAPLDFD